MIPQGWHKVRWLKRSTATLSAHCTPVWFIANLDVVTGQVENLIPKRLQVVAINTAALGVELHGLLLYPEISACLLQHAVSAAACYDGLLTVAAHS